MGPSSQMETVAISCPLGLPPPAPSTTAEGAKTLVNASTLRGLTVDEESRVSRLVITLSRGVVSAQPFLREARIVAGGGEGSGDGGVTAFIMRA